MFGHFFYKFAYQKPKKFIISIFFNNDWKKNNLTQKSTIYLLIIIFLLKWLIGTMTKFIVFDCFLKWLQFFLTLFPCLIFWVLSCPLNQNWYFTFFLFETVLKIFFYSFKTYFGQLFHRIILNYLNLCQIIDRLDFKVIFVTEYVNTLGLDWASLLVPKSQIKINVSFNWTLNGFWS